MTYKATEYKLPDGSKPVIGSREDADKMWDAYFEKNGKETWEHSPHAPAFWGDTISDFAV